MTVCSLGVLIHVLGENFGVALEVEDLPYGWGGYRQVRTLRRNTPGGIRFSPLRQLKDTERLPEDVIVSICRELDINPDDVIALIPGARDLVRH